MVAINNLYMAKMPNSCKECPLTYLDTGDDAYFGANERRCVIDDSCIDGMVSERAYDCPLVEAIPKEEVRQFIENIQKIKDNHNEHGEPINYGTICGILIEGYRLLDKYKEAEDGNAN